jgi:hypothetical protein
MHWPRATQASEIADCGLKICDCGLQTPDCGREDVDERCFPNPWLARDEYNLAFAGQCFFPPAVELSQFGFTTNQCHCGLPPNGGGRRNADCGLKIFDFGPFDYAQDRLWTSDARQFLTTDC